MHRWEGEMGWSQQKSPHQARAFRRGLDVVTCAEFSWCGCTLWRSVFLLLCLRVLLTLDISRLRRQSHSEYLYLYDILCEFNPCSAGMDFRRQNLTSKVDPCYPVWLGSLTHLLREAQSRWPPFCLHSQLCKNETRAAYQKTRMPRNWDEYFRCLWKLGQFSAGLSLWSYWNYYISKWRSLCQSLGMSSG